MVFRDAVGMVAGGLLAAVPIALRGARLATGLIVAGSGVPVAVGALGMMMVALAASWIPVRRAARAIRWRR